MSITAMVVLTLSGGVLVGVLSAVILSGGKTNGSE